MTALLESPAATAVADAAKANAAVSLVSQRLLDAQGDLVEINAAISELVLWSEVDPAQRSRLDAARGRQRDAEQRVQDLVRAESLARELAAAAERRVLSESKVQDWQVAGEMFDQALGTAEELDAALVEIVELYQRLQREMGEGFGRCQRHLNEGQAIATNPGNFDRYFLLALKRLGGPADPDLWTSNGGAPLADLVRLGAANVMRHRPKEISGE